MSRFLAEHLSTWAGMFFLALYVLKGSVLYAVGFVVMFLVSTFFALYRYVEFTVYTQDERRKFQEECARKRASNG